MSQGLSAPEILDGRSGSEVTAHNDPKQRNSSWRCLLSLHLEVPGFDKAEFRVCSLRCFVNFISSRTPW